MFDDYCDGMAIFVAASARIDIVSTAGCINSICNGSYYPTHTSHKPSFFLVFYFTLLSVHLYCECFSCGDRKTNYI